MFLTRLRFQILLRMFSVRPSCLRSTFGGQSTQRCAETISLILCQLHEVSSCPILSYPAHPFWAELTSGLRLPSGAKHIKGDTVPTVTSLVSWIRSRSKLQSLIFHFPEQDSGHQTLKHFVLRHTILTSVRLYELPLEVQWSVTECPSRRNPRTKSISSDTQRENHGGVTGRCSSKTSTALKDLRRIKSWLKTLVQIEFVGWLVLLTLSLTLPIWFESLPHHPCWIC